MNHNVMILSGVRTPIGSLGGSLATVPAVELGAICIKAALERARVASVDVSEVILGNVVGAGLGQNPGRQAMIRAGIPVSVGAMTVNKVCGSGLKAVMMAAQSIRLGDSKIVVAGGMESMSSAPYMLLQARHGYRFGHGELVDASIHDGLWDCYGNKHMGTYGDRCAKKLGFSRADQDDFAVRSYTRARSAMADHAFDGEIVAVPVTGKNATVVAHDEEPLRFDENKLRALRPAFGAEGTITAGNAPSVNDGAAALIVASQAACESTKLTPIARIVASTTFSREPEWFTLAPIGALRKLLDAVNWSVADVDLFEINEAFAAVAIAAERDLRIPAEKLNIYGGAVALGHPIGCTGARILVTLLNALQRTNGRRGVACLCIGGGEAVAMAIERSE